MPDLKSPDNRPLRIGLVGTGIGSLHADAISRMPEAAQLQAVCSLELEAAQSLAARFGGMATNRFDELLKDPSIDIIDVCTPPDQHLPMAQAAASAGKHLLIEKPLARTLEEADGIIQAARSAGVRLMTAHNMRYMGQHLKAKQLLDAGAIGTPFMLVATVHVHGQIEGFRRSLEPSGGGTLIDSGVHRFDLIRWLMGDVTTIYAQTGRFMQMQMEGEDCAVVTMRFRSGAIGNFSCSWSAKGRQEETLQIFGPKGAILTENYANTLQLYSENPPAGLEDAREWIFPVDQTESMRREIHAFVESIRRGESPPITGEDGRSSLELTLASYRSAASDQPVILPM